MVMKVIKEHKIAVNLCDIWEDSAHEDKLIQDRGKRTVPVLYIDGVPMGESNDIMRWLEENKDYLEKVSK